MLAIVTDVHYRMAVALLRDLVEAGVTVIACERDDVPQPIGFFVRGVARCEVVSADNYKDALCALCARLAEEYGEKPALLPVGATTLAMLSENRAQFDAVCGLCIAVPAQLALLNDKAALGALGAALSLPVPTCYVQKADETAEEFAARVPLPCVVKPVCGEKFGLHAESRYRIARSAQALYDAVAHFCAITNEAPIVQEYLSGGGMGCSVLAKDGEIVYSICHRRVREYPVSGGPSSCCECIDAPALVSAVAALVKEVGFSGPAMFEFKLDASGKPRLLECNPRIWGTYPLTRAAKTSFALCWCCLSLGAPLPARPAPAHVKMAYYPSDFAAALGYLRQKEVKKCAAALRDALDPRVKNGLHEKTDPLPARMYWKNLLKRSGRK